MAKGLNNPKLHITEDLRFGKYSTVSNLGAALIAAAGGIAPKVVTPSWNVTKGNRKSL